MNISAILPHDARISTTCHAFRKIKILRNKSYQNEWPPRVEHVKTSTMVFCHHSEIWSNGKSTCPVCSDQKQHCDTSNNADMKFETMPRNFTAEILNNSKIAFDLAALLKNGLLGIFIQRIFDVISYLS